jgi:hypothetical protein
VQEYLWCRCGRAFNRIVLDCFGVEGEFSDLEKYETGQSMAETCLSRSMYPTITLIGKPPTITEFEALLARNRGLTASRFPTAKDWIG